MQMHLQSRSEPTAQQPAFRTFLAASEAIEMGRGGTDNLAMFWKSFRMILMLAIALAIAKLDGTGRRRGRDAPAAVLASRSKLVPDS